MTRWEAPVSGTTPRAHAAGRTPSPVSVVIHVKPGYRDELLRLLCPVLDAMRHEPMFINAVLHCDPDDPTRFMIYEMWADRQDLVEVQIPRTYRKRYLDRLPAVLREERQISVWQPMRSDFAFSTDCERNRS